MALLHRFSKLNDRLNTGIFTFIVTRSVTRDLHRDATTKDFYYGYHRWAISFARANDKVLGVYLILRDTSPTAICYADYTLALLNREHFSRNEQFSEKQCKFTHDHPAHGIAKWIPLSDIQNRNFGDETGEFLLELSLGNVMTVFEAEIPLQQSSNSSSNHSGTNGGHHPLPHHPSAITSVKNGKIETNYFHFASFEWNISIVAQSPTSGAASMVRGLFKDSNSNQDFFNSSDNSGRSGSNRTYQINLNRLTGFENACRAQFRFLLGQGQFREDSGVLEQISDVSGKSRGHQVDAHTFANLTQGGTLHLYFEFFRCNPLSEVKVPLARSLSPVINCYDRNKQGWCLEADAEGQETIKLKLYFMDMHSVPRNHLRYVSWYTFVITNNADSPTSTTSGSGLSGSGTGSGLGNASGSECIPVRNGPHFNYYIQDGIDMGVVMDSPISTQEIKANPKRWLENDSHMTVHVEWNDSIQLFNHIYHKYDDIARTHCYQMRREIAALTAENYSLERQIFAYQKSISAANTAMARLSISSPVGGSPLPLTFATASGLGQQQQQQQQQQHQTLPQLSQQQQQQPLPLSRSGSYRNVSQLPSAGPISGTADMLTVSTEAFYRRASSAGEVGAINSSAYQGPAGVPITSGQALPTQSYYGAQFNNSVLNGRQSFSGPASPQRQPQPGTPHQQSPLSQSQQGPGMPQSYSSHQGSPSTHSPVTSVHYLQQQQQQPSQQQQQQQQHQLPIIPSKLTYSSSGYMLNNAIASGATSPQQPMYMFGAGNDANSLINNTDDYGGQQQQYLSRYKLQV